MCVLGLSASLLVGRTAVEDTQLLPGPGQHTSMKTQDHMVPLGQQEFLKVSPDTVILQINPLLIVLGTIYSSGGYQWARLLTQSCCCHCNQLQLTEVSCKDKGLHNLRKLYGGETSWRIV